MLLTLDLRLPLWVVVLLCAEIQATAGEQIVLRFREAPVCDSNVIRLENLVEVLSNSKEMDQELLRLVLAPAPREGEAQTWTSKMVIEHLTLRGIHGQGIRWSGSDSVRVARATRAAAELGMTAMSPAFVQDRTLSQAALIVEQAINEYISLKSDQKVAWRVAAKVPPEYATRLLVKRNIVGIGGGLEPWSGSQKFVLQLNDRGQRVNIPIEADVSQPTLAVVAARPIRQDEILTADALAYGPLTTRQETDSMSFFDDIERLVGQQMRKSVATGVPITKQTIGPPIIVSRGEALEIESVSGGVSVRTSGRSLSPGAIGDSILVEVIPSGKKITATVVSHRKVRIAAVPDRSQRGDDQIVAGQ